jgi:2-oxoglutarate dehydrogenase E1 component
LISTDLTASFFVEKFPSAKVFGIEGCEALVPALWAIIIEASNLGVEGIEMGLAHRGRMNILHNVLGKSLSSICNQFNESDYTHLGDVKYHLGTRSEIVIKDSASGKNRRMHLSLAANPSHLEHVNAVVIGKTKAKQFHINDVDMKRVMPLLLHGDASFSGQGIVAEVLELSNQPDYTVGGCIHVIVNNQIGFTTDPRLQRKHYQCTNVAKGVGAPIFHVNGDDVEAVVNVCRLATQWRQIFKKDVVIDIVCYRRHGHNNLDDPRITLPLLYQCIEQHPSLLEIYSKSLLDLNIVSKEDINAAKVQVFVFFFLCHVYFYYYDSYSHFLWSYIASEKV